MPSTYPPHKAYSAQIAQLDPETEYERIAFLLSCHVFPWDLERALEFALFRTFAVPSISAILADTGEFTHRPRKRYDDTELILYEILEHGMSSLRGQRAIRRMNAMHARFNISNEDFLYVLSTFIFEPIRWMERYAWRPFTPLEKRAIFLNYIALGHRMRLKDIPSSYEEFEAYNIRYEQEHFAYAESNRTVSEKTVELLLGFYVPRWLYGPVRPFVHALMDAPLQQAVGIRPPAGWKSRLLEKALALRARWEATRPEPEQPVLGTRRHRPTYPEGYQIEELGTFHRGAEG